MPERTEDIEVIRRALRAAQDQMRNALGIDPMRSLHAREIRDGLEALDRVRDARGDDEGRVRIPPLCDRCGGDHYITEHEAPPARSPQGEDREKVEAIGAYLAQYPPSGFTDRYSADGWSHIARGVLSAAAIFAVPSPSRDGTVAEIVRRLRYSDGIAPDAAVREIADWIESQEQAERRRRVASGQVWKWPQAKP